MKNNYNEKIKDLYNDPVLYIEEFKDYKDDIYFWPKLLKKIKPNTVLEVGIGNGRLIDLLHNGVLQYDGVDFSIELVKYCEEKYSYDNVKLYSCDIKKFKSETKYDLILLPFNVINNFYSKDDIFKVFNSIKNLSHEETLVVIDTFNPQKYDLVDIEEYYKARSFNIDNSVVDVYEKKIFNIFDSVNVYSKKYVSNSTVISEVELPNRVFFHEELIFIIECYGFELVDVYGDYDFSDLTKNSRKQILIFRRK